MRISVKILLVSALPLLTLPGFTEVPQMINYQGRLTDSATGDPYDGDAAMIFSIWDDSSGGTQLWEETHPIVSVSQGLFNVLLGSIDSIPDTVFAQPNVWLDIVANGNQIEPRTQIVSVGYAYHALRSDTADLALSGGSGWVDDGTVVRLQTVTDSVGIGTNDPGYKLHIQDGPIYNEWSHMNDKTPNLLVKNLNHGLTTGFSNLTYGVFSAVASNGSEFKTSIYAQCWGDGGIKRGVFGTAYGNGEYNMGVEAQAKGAPDRNFGIHTVAVGAGGTNYGIYASASDAAENWAGYFKGDVRIYGTLDIDSTGALIVSRITTAERDALSPVNGMIIYNTTDNQFNFYENGSWVVKY
jgi:hypothetical protein